MIVRYLFSFGQAVKPGQQAGAFLALEKPLVQLRSDGIRQSPNFAVPVVLGVVSLWRRGPRPPGMMRGGALQMIRVVFAHAGRIAHFSGRARIKYTKSCFFCLFCIFACAVRNL
jgi:hypothetical protein